MLVGVDASRYGQEKATGVELYTNKVIDGLLKRVGDSDVVWRLYVAHEWQVEKLHGFLSNKVEIRLIKRKRLWTQVGLAKEMKKDPPDLLFVPSHVLPRICPKKSVVVVHGLEALSFPKAYSGFVRKYQKMTTKYAVKKTSKLIAVSKAVKGDLMNYFDCPEEKIEVVYEGAQERRERREREEREGKVILSVGRVEERREREGKVILSVGRVEERRERREREEREGKVILSVGRVEERKNQLRLLKAFKLFFEGNPNWKLVFVGPDGYGAEKVHAFLKKQSAEFQKAVELKGFQGHEEVMRLLAGASVFAYPSLAEGFGLPILEAMSVGTPVLTSRGTACAEIGGEAVLQVDPLSVDDILRGLREITGSDQLRSGLVEKGHKRVKEFSWDKCVDQIYRILVQ